ncbi:MAG TPA: triose-phosphate isomerase [Nitrospira sp.]|nr:triose-phosphate isomerase [Nitrospira sp.]
MPTPLIVGNWKMNKTASEAVLFVRELLANLSPSSNAEVVIAPPFTALESVRSALGASRIALGAQNLHWESHGAYTGEISGPMLRDLGCRYVIVGHSERRTLFGERDEDVRKKIRAALTHGLRPILCVGELLTERETGRTAEVVTHQLSEGLQGLDVADVEQITIAYEPVWAIGTGRAATVEQAVAVHELIRGFLRKTWHDEIASAARVLYGGSVTPQNAASLLAPRAINGALVGSSCLKADSFATIVSAADKTKSH